MTVKRAAKFLNTNEDHVRLLSSEGKIGKIYVLYVKDSQEEKWLKSSVRKLDNVTWLLDN